jgi:hypothetical protein
VTTAKAARMRARREMAASPFRRPAARAAAAPGGSRRRGRSRSVARPGRAAHGRLPRGRRWSASRPAEYHAGIAGQRCQEVELAWPQVEAASPDIRLSPPRIDAQLADLDGPDAAGSPIGPAQDGLDPCHQLARVERLDDVVVGADFEADDAIDLVAPRGEHDDGRFTHPTQLAGHIQAIHARQHEVEHDEVGVVPLDQFERGPPIAGTDDREALLLEVEPEQLDDVAFVVDDQDRLHPGEDTMRERGIPLAM